MQTFSLAIYWLTHWGRVTYKCVVELAIIGSDNGLSPGRRQAIIWTNAGILLIGPLGTNFSEILIEILLFSFKKMRLKVSSAKWRPFCLCLNVLINPITSAPVKLQSYHFSNSLCMESFITMEWWWLVGIDIVGFLEDKWWQKIYFLLCLIVQKYSGDPL